jgi:hypothetical protein
MSCWETLRRERERAAEKAKAATTPKRRGGRLEKLKHSALTQAEAMSLAETLLPGGSKLAHFRLALVFRIGDPAQVAAEVVRHTRL